MIKWAEIWDVGGVWPGQFLRVSNPTKFISLWAKISILLKILNSIFSEVTWLANESYAVLKSMVLGLLQDTNNSIALWGTLEISGLFWCHLHWMKFYETKKFWPKFFYYSLWKYPKSIKAIDPGIIFYLVGELVASTIPFTRTQ